jgi:DNA-binding NtrC family response regulator
VVTPLRERLEDIVEIADHLLRQIAKELKIAKRTLHPNVIQQMLNYSFSGNIRKLFNLPESACILSSRTEIDWLDLPEAAAEPSLKDELLPNISAPSLPEEFHLRSALADSERSIIEQTLLRTKSAKAEAVRRPELSKSDLTCKLAKYGINTNSCSNA